jgi:hypothetical protein
VPVRLITSSAAWGFVVAFSSDLADLGQDGFADSGGVKIHYVTKGAGPLVVLIHGIPGFWYDWRNQIPALAEHFQVVAIDQRGFNLSDQPEGVENYALGKLVLCHTLIVGSDQPIMQRFLAVSANEQPDFLGVTQH